MVCMVVDIARICESFDGRNVEFVVVVNERRKAEV
jgi:hypothetical protein